MKFTKKQFEDFLEIANQYSTFREKVEKVLGKKLTYQEESDFKEQINEYFNTQSNQNTGEKKNGNK